MCELEQAAKLAMEIKKHLYQHHCEQYANQHQAMKPIIIIITIYTMYHGSSYYCQKYNRRDRRDRSDIVSDNNSIDAHLHHQHCHAQHNDTSCYSP